MPTPRCCPNSPQCQTHFATAETSVGAGQTENSKSGRPGSSESSCSCWLCMLGVQQQRRGKRAKPLLRLVERRGRQDLVTLIAHHVKIGSSIISDEWRAYRTLPALGYNHMTFSEILQYKINKNIKRTVFVCFCVSLLKYCFDMYFFIHIVPTLTTCSAHSRWGSCEKHS